MAQQEVQHAAARPATAHATVWAAQLHSRRWLPWTLAAVFGSAALAAYCLWRQGVNSTLPGGERLKSFATGKPVRDIAHPQSVFVPIAIMDSLWLQSEESDRSVDYTPGENATEPVRFLGTVSRALDADSQAINIPLATVPGESRFLPGGNRKLTPAESKQSTPAPTSRHGAKSEQPRAQINEPF